MNPLIRLIPSRLVRFFARPYVAGDSLQRALDVAAGLWQEQGLATTLDLLAEDIADEATVERNVQTYLHMIDAAAADARFPGAGRPTVSLKLSSYTLAPRERGGDAAGSRAAALRISEHARRRQVGLTIDMESRHWTDFTLETLRELHAAGHDHVGAVLQTRLHRTRDDLDRLPPRCRVRLVIGIYQEPVDVALTDKRAMKERLLEYAGLLLGRGHYVEFGTHDEQYVRRFVDEVVPAAGAGTDRFELQMLYGVPRHALLQQMRARGVKARLYVPFALSWPMAIAYLRRRLDEYPAMMWLVAKSEVRRVLGRRPPAAGPGAPASAAHGEAAGVVPPPRRDPLAASGGTPLPEDERSLSEPAGQEPAGAAPAPGSSPPSTRAAGRRTSAP